MLSFVSPPDIGGLRTVFRLSISAAAHDLDCAVERFIIGRDPSKVVIAANGTSAVFENTGDTLQEALEFTRATAGYQVHVQEHPSPYSSSSDLALGLFPEDASLLWQVRGVLSWRRPAAPTLTVEVQPGQFARAACLVRLMACPEVEIIA